MPNPVPAAGAALSGPALPHNAAALRFLAGEHGSRPRKALRALARLREAVADEIDRLVAFLDRTEIPEDFEPCGCGEPSLGAPEIHERGDQAGWARGSQDEREISEGDAEPWLGLPEGAQSAAYSGAVDDLEDDPAEAGIADAAALALLREEGLLAEWRWSRSTDYETRFSEIMADLDRQARRQGVWLPGASGRRIAGSFVQSARRL